MKYARELKDNDLIASVSCFTGYINWMLGNFHDATNHFGNVIKMADVVKELEPIGIAHGVLGRDQVYNRKLKQGISSLEIAEPILMNAGNLYEGIACPLNLGLGYALSGEFEKGIDTLRNGLDTARQNGIPSLEHWFLNWEGLAWMYKGEWKKAVETYNQAIQIARRLGDPVPELWGSSFQGYALAMNGNPESGLSLCKKAAETLEEFGVMVLISWHFALLGDIYFINGNNENAVEFANKSLGRKPHGDTAGEFFALHILAKVASYTSSPDWASVEIRMQESVDLANSLGARPELSAIHFRYAEILHKQGRLGRRPRATGQGGRSFPRHGDDLVERAGGRSAGADRWGRAVPGVRALCGWSGRGVTRPTRTPLASKRPAQGDGGCGHDFGFGVVLDKTAGVAALAFGEFPLH